MARQLLITTVMTMRVAIRSNSTSNSIEVQRRDRVVGRDHVAGGRQRIVAIGHLVCRRYGQVVDPGGEGEIAEIDDARDALVVCGIDHDVVRIEIVVDVLLAQIPQRRERMGFETIENPLDQTALARRGRHR